MIGRTTLLIVISFFSMVSKKNAFYKIPLTSLYSKNLIREYLSLITPSLECLNFLRRKLKFPKRLLLKELYRVYEAKSNFVSAIKVIREAEQLDDGNEEIVTRYEKDSLRNKLKRVFNRAISFVTCVCNPTQKATIFEELVNLGIVETVDSPIQDNTTTEKYAEVIDFIKKVLEGQKEMSEEFYAIIKKPEKDLIRAVWTRNGPN